MVLAAQEPILRNDSRFGVDLVFLLLLFPQKIREAVSASKSYICQYAYSPTASKTIPTNTSLTTWHKHAHSATGWEEAVPLADCILDPAAPPGLSQPVEM